MPATRFCLVRHGETDWNLQRRHQGHLDIPLNANGCAQALAAARGLRGHRFSTVYSSDLKRTRETARVIGGELGLPVQDLAGLRERHYGLLQGLTPDEVQRLAPDVYRAYKQRDLDHDLAGGETLRGFNQRILDTIHNLTWQHSGQSVLLVTHGGVLDLIHRRCLQSDLTAPRDFPIPNAAFNWIEVNGPYWRLIEWAQQDHLLTTLDEVA